MTLKYLIQINEALIIALRWRNNTCSIGGYDRNILYMQEIIGKFISSKIPRPEYTQVNKIRFDIKMSRDDFKKCLEGIENSGVSITPTKSFYRIMF